MGITFAIFILSGTIPLTIDKLITCSRGIAISLMICFNKSLLISSNPLLYLLLDFSTISIISSLSVGMKTVYLYFCSLNNARKIFQSVVSYLQG